MDCTKAWEEFVRTGLVCDYLQYVTENRRSNEMSSTLLQSQNYEKETKTPCSVLRTE